MADLREVTDQGPYLRLGIHQMLDSHSGVGGQASISNNPQHHRVACLSNSRWGCEIEFITHAQLGVPALVVVEGAGGKVLKDNMVEEGRRVVENRVGVCEIVCLQAKGRVGREEF